MSRDPRTPDCAIKDCTRAAGRGLLCTKHRALVPREMIMRGWIEGIAASRNIARKHHKRQVAYVRNLLRA